MREKLAIFLVLAFPLAPAVAQVGDLDVPSSVPAGNAISIATSGKGKATYYLAGPSSAMKGTVELGQAIRLQPTAISAAGRYFLTICSDSCHSATFFVTASDPDSLSMLVHPSRVPVDRQNAISLVAFAFDRFNNLILAPETVEIHVTVDGAAVTSRALQTHDGVAWLRTGSGKRAGKVTLEADLGEVSAQRVLQQVASEPCNLRIQSQETPKGTVVETQPLRDCSGNPVPDGTIVTFTETGANGKTTVDAPLKQGVARARMAPGPATVTVASGVVMGNEIRLGAKP